MNYYSILRAVKGLVFVILIAFATDLSAQSFDHESYPKLDFNFQRLNLELGIQPENMRIDGAATYSLEANIDEADTIIVYASHLDISSVRLDGKKVDYTLSNDSLFVPLASSSRAGDEYELNIRYSGDPHFGLVGDTFNSVWTSMLPKAQRHWVPIVDNPQNTLKTSFKISVPAGYEVWASGVKVGEKAATTEVMTYHFESEEIPASDLAFAVGQFESETTSSGDKLLNVAVEEPLTYSVEASQILELADSYLNIIEDSLQADYPYRDLNIMVLSDHTWETKAWGASTVFLYNNRGSLENQLLRGIIGQWFGVAQRVGQWNQADAINLYQTILAKDIADSTLLDDFDYPETPVATVYDKFSSERWNKWQQNITHWKNSSLLKRISELKSDLYKKAPAVIDWQTYADYWYQSSGQPLFDLPAFKAEDEVEQSTTDSIVYEVNYSLDEGTGELVLTFNAKENAYDKLVTIPALAINMDGTTETSEVTFTGKDDSVVLQVKPIINTLQLETSAHPELHLEEYKPVSFLLYDLQNGETLEQRREAAAKLGYHADNPDLQLAIRDYLRRGVEPEIEAALLSSLSRITKGARGTEQVFLDALRDEHEVVRDSALTALQYYDSNETVQQQVQRTVIAADDMDTFIKGIDVLTAISSPAQFNTFVENVINNGGDAQRAIIAIREMANMGETEEAIKKAELFTSADYPFGIRRSALEILTRHDQNVDSWLLRAKSLLGEQDPRIRFLVLEALEGNSISALQEFLQEYRQDEYDARVYYQLMKVLGN